MKKGQIKNTLIVILFVLAIALPLLTVKWTGSDYSETEKRLLAPIPTILQADGSLNPNVGHEMKSWLEDHIGFREQLVLLSGRIKLNLFNQSPSEQVHIGSDGWYYYTGDTNLEIASGQYPLTEETLKAILQNHLAIRDKLARQGIEYVIVMPVSKVSIYPEYMRFGSGDVRETPVDVVADYLEKNSDLKVVRLKEVLLEAKESEQVFFKTDTHWNQYGAYVAYKKIIEDMNRWGLCDTQPEEVSFMDAEYQGEFAAMMGSADFIPPEATRNSVILEQNAVKNALSTRYSAVQEVIAQEGIYNPCYYYENQSANGPSVLMYGDSMFGSWNVTELLAEHFSEMTYIWDYNIRQSIVDELSPDIVIYEITERYLNIFPTKNLSFMQMPLGDYQAQIVSYELTDNELKVTVKNTSSVEWTATNQIGCMLWIDGVDKGKRAMISGVNVVEPGEIVTFHFEDMPTVIQAQSLEIQMLQEGICYFGERRLMQIGETELFARIIDYTVPENMSCLDSSEIQVTVKNTGTKIWSEAEQIRLCIWQDGMDLGHRVALPDGQTVAPGEKYTFTLEDFVMPKASSTVLEFQMLQETVMYFGEKVPVTITVE